MAILKPEGKILDENLLETCFRNNDDGAGFMFAKDGELNLEKGFFTFRDFWQSYDANMKKYKNPVAIVHFRIKTHGKTDKMNCHPHLVNTELGFAHNGIISFTGTHLKKSDTILFNNQVLKQLPLGFIYNQAIMTLIEESIGSSKLVFLNSDGYYAIANESLGVHKEGCWFSNYSYISYTTPVVKTVHNVYNGFGHWNYGKKKKTKYNLFYTICQYCNTTLSTRYEQTSGMCERCDVDLKQYSK